MRKPASFVLFLALLSPVVATALGLGNIKLNSALNQPLDAEIELVSASPAELDTLGITLASADAFASYGLDRPAYLLGMRFRVVRDGSGGATVKVTTDQPVREPFVTFLVEADWARGRLLREYTVLLDPPVFMREEPAAATPRATPAATQPASGGVTRQPAAPPAVETTPAAPPTPPSGRASPGSIEGMSTRYGPIRRAETLWTIASRLKPDQSVSVNQMMIALFRENPQAFLGNINLLRQGAVLRVPSRADIYALSASEAFAEVRSQNAAWRGAKPAAATRPSTAAASGAGSSAAGTGASGRLRLVPPGDAAREQASARQTGQDAPTDSELAGNRALSERIQSLESELDNARRLIDVKDSELSSLQARLEALEERLAEEGSAAAVDGEMAPADAADVAADESVTVPGSDVEQAVADETADETVAEVEEPVGVVVTPPAVQPVESTGFFARIFDFLSGAWLWILGLLAVGLAGAFFFLMRGRSADDGYADSWETGEWNASEGAAAAAAAPAAEPEASTETQPAPDFGRDESFVVVEAEDTITEEALKPPQPEPEVDDFAAALGDAFEDTGTFTPGELEVEKAQQVEAADDDAADYPFEDTMIGHDALKLDESDPVAEADFHMAYGLYDQAAALVERAVEKNPENRELKMKLMEIFFVWGNKDRFLEEAEAFKSSVGDAGAGDWEKVAIMGKQLIPDNDLFVNTEATGVFSAPDLEFDMGDEDGSATATDLDFLGGGDDDVLDIGAADEGGEDLTALKEKIEGQAEPSEETLDLGSSHVGLDLDLETAGDENNESTAVNESIPDDDSGTDQVATVAGGGLDEDLEIDLDFQFEDVSDDEPTAVLEDVDEQEIADMLADSDSDSDSGDGDQTRIQEAPPVEDDDATRVTDTSDFDPFADDGDMTVETPAGGAEDHGATMQMARIDVDEDVSALLDDESGGDEDATRQIKKVDQTFGGDETVQISRSDAMGDDDGTAQINLGDANSDLTTQLPSAGANGQDLAADDFDDDDDDEDVEATQKLQALEMPDSNEMDEVGTKLDLARAFVDMGDPEGARNILHEVLDEGNDSQREEAKNMLDNLG
ncbi:MAG: hypothetical protein HKN59_04560 [Gammaproteobacteria bacterium]|nr:hypothetical protein [Gammaproteobacteria bacterium]